MRDAYTAVSGQTYEKDTILEHIRLNGNIDPVTRLKYNSEPLVPNHAIKAVCDSWAKIPKITTQFVNYKNLYL